MSPKGNSPGTRKENGAAKPTIKGIFVNSHVKALRKLLGEDGVRELQTRCGRAVSFRNSEDVPVAVEVDIIETSLDIIRGGLVSDPDRAFEAGRLHFRNFTTTPLARIIFTLFRTDFKTMMMKTQNIAGHVFQGILFASAELGPTSVRITMDNNDYPLDHFRGLFHEWMAFAGCRGTVEARELPDKRYQYDLSWS